MTPERLAEIKTRCDKAVGGPWEVEVSHWATAIAYLAEHEGKTILLTAPRHYSTSEFITHARQDIPDLLAEVERLRRENDELHDNLERLEEMLP